MMDCRAFMEALDRGLGAGTLSGDLREHVDSCRRCGLELRSRRLLALGSEVRAETPRAGFASRLRARLSMEARPADWSEAIGLVARPAFGLAAAVALLTIGLYSAVPSTAGQDDLALLAERDPIASLLLTGSPIELLVPPEGAQR